MIDDITKIVWNSSSFDNLAIFVTKKKIITVLAKTHIFRAFDDVIDDFVKKKSQDLIIFLQYEFRRLILYHRLTYISSEFSEVSKILIVEELFEYLERLFYAISLALVRLSDSFDFSDICRETWSEREDAWRAAVDYLSSLSSLKNHSSSWWSRRVCAITLFRQLT